MRQNIQIIAILLMTNLSSIALAQAQTPSQVPKPDAQGDYYSNVAPIKGTVPPGNSLMVGSLWQVVSQKLNCRRQPSLQAPVVRRFRTGNILQAEVFRGGSDEVLINAKDAAGKPWMWVRAATFKLEDACYVRANDRYIKPVTKPLR